MVERGFVDRHEIPLIVSGAERELQHAPGLADDGFSVLRLRGRKESGASGARDDLADAELIVAAAIRIERRERRVEVFVPVRNHVDAVLVEDVPQLLHSQRRERA